MGRRSLTTTFGLRASKLKALVGIRARLILLALILVGPLMFDRIQMLEETRAKQAVQATVQLSELAQHTADAQREIIATVEAVLKSSAYIYKIAPDPGRGCAILRASMRIDLPWVRSLSLVDKNGVVRCSSATHVLGLDLADRDYFKLALHTSGFVVSEYIFSRASNLPTIMTAYPATNAASGERAVIIAAIDLQWMSQLLSRHIHHPGVSAILVDSAGTVLARSENAAAIGQPLADTSLLAAVTAREIGLDRGTGAIRFTSSEGPARATFARVTGTNARMIISVNEARMLGDIDANIRTAYTQFALVIVFALLGAWLVGETLIIRPIQVITAMAERFGGGDLSTRASNAPLPREFKPLVNAFNRMAVQLAERQRDLVATNDRLTVMASIDVISGLANRRGFQSRLDFEWLKARSTGDTVSLIMIDVDHFKPFNDSYGHPEGDACLGRVGEVLAAIANETASFAARYGGEEFCLLIPGAGAATALEIGEAARKAVESLGIPHAMSEFSYVTISAGIASVRPDDTLSPQELVEAADAALYAAKHQGRNAVVAHGLAPADDAAMPLAG